jgi:MATE family multidrug resistance protein
LVSEATVASEPLSHARVLKIALPIVVSNATVPLLGIVDTAVVGNWAIRCRSVRWGWARSSCPRSTGSSGFAHGDGGPCGAGAGRAGRGEVAALLTRVLMIGVGAGLA